MDKRGKSNKNNMIILGVVAIIGVLLFGFWRMGAFSGIGTSGGQGLSVQQALELKTGEQPTGERCILPGQTYSFDTRFQDRAQTGVRVVGTYRLEYNGADIGSSTSGTALTTLIPNKAYHILTTNSSYYGTRLDGVTPCEPSTILVSEDLALMGGIDATATNGPNYITTNTNSSTGAYAIGSGGTGTFKITLTENVAKAYWTNPQINWFVVVTQMNSTLFEGTSDKTYIEGTTPVSVPTSVTSIGGTNALAFKVSGNIYNLESRDLKLIAKAKDGQNPGGNDGTGFSKTEAVNGTTNILYTVLDADYYIHTIDGPKPDGSGILTGVENNAGTAIGATNKPDILWYT